MHCFFCRNIGQPGTYVELDERDAKHLFKTLRANCGERIELTDGQGTFALAEVGAGRKITIVSVETAAPSTRRIHLFIVPPKKAKMDILLKQCAEVGVWSINPFLSARSVSTPEKDEVLEHWRTLLLEGCKQAKNPFLPQVSGLPVSFKQAVENCRSQGYRGFFGSVRGDGTKPELDEVNDIAWFVGPEGGFTSEEEDFLRQAGIADLRIGRWVLRVETAAICGCLYLQM